MSPQMILGIIIAYFFMLICISWFTSRKSDNNSFFNANKNSPWYLVAFGMIGASLSGVTFISIPGVVGAGGTNMAFSYMQMVYGYLVGYFIIATVLMPIYYKYNLTTIYGFLEERFGIYAYKTSAGYFILSRIVGSAFRVYLVALVLDTFVFAPMGLSFNFTVAMTIFLIWVYTYKGGIKTIVITDTLQTFCMISAVIATIVIIGQQLQLSPLEIFSTIKNSEYSKMWFFEGGWNDPNNFFKQFISGALIALVMTGLDQDMMQKNLTCRNLKDAQKNMFTFSLSLVATNFLFLGLGALLFIYAAQQGIEVPAKTDQFYPTIALNHLPPIVGVLFIIGLIAAAYSSADSALTALTTSFCIDFLNFEKKNRSEPEKKKLRIFVHLGFSFILLLVIIFFHLLNNDAIINSLFKAAGFTYGPILGLFAFAILTKRNLPGPGTLIVCLLAPVLSFILDMKAAELLGNFQFGNMIIALNGFLTFIGLYAISSLPTVEKDKVLQTP
ncbi:MAG: sodium:solute symporter [Saprospiraceae bacterium]|nr:sodium:solute symporter [Saprospiraceae bacterium]